MQWATIETALPTEIERITGLSPVRWSGQPSGWSPSRFVELSLVSLTAIGRDELRSSCPTPETIQYRVYGIRRFVVQVKIDSQSQGLASNALSLAETLMASLWRCPATCDALALAEISVGRLGAARVADYCDCDGRLRSAVMFDVFFNTNVSVECGTVPTVAKVEYTGIVTDAEGNEVLNTTETVTGP